MVRVYFAMGSLKVDLIVFGATGFTGKYIVEECARMNNFSWAVAGRSVLKLRELLKHVSVNTGIDITQKNVIIADCGRPDSLLQMADKGKVIINCTGPYRFYGESVVKACIDRGTHYVDITGEPEFMEKMQLLYHDLAKIKGCYIVSACGMDSVPVDVGIMHFSKNFNGQVNYVETYMKLSIDSNKHAPFLNYTTWESAVHGFANQNSLIQIRKKLFSKSQITKPQPLIPRRPTVHPSPLFEDKPSVPFPGSDRSVVMRTQMFLTNEFNLRPIQCNTYLVCQSKLTLWALLLVGYFLQILTQYGFGIKLLLRFPRLFSLGMTANDSPTQETVFNTYTILKFYGEGWSEEILKEKGVEPKNINEPTDSYMITSLELHNAAYGFTSMCAVQCALLLLNETEKLPPGGGVYTPAGVFYNTSIIEILAKHGVEFKVVRKSRK